jgi:hypothetical protein
MRDYLVTQIVPQRFATCAARHAVVVEGADMERMIHDDRVLAQAFYTLIVTH